MTAPAVTPDPHLCPVCDGTLWPKPNPAAPESLLWECIEPTCRPIDTLGDLLVELLAAFTTSNANQAELLDRVEKLEARFTDECPCNNDVFGEGPCRDCRAAFAKRES